MTLFKSLRRAVIGWREILLGRPTWSRAFALSRGGIALALAVYFGLLVIVLAAEASSGAGLCPVQLSIGVLVNALPLLALAVSVLLTGLLLRWPVPASHLLVPGIYGLTFVFLVSLLLVFLPGQFSSLSILILAAMLYRLARVAGTLGVAAALGFTVLTVVLLVGLPVALYMLTVSGGAPI